MNLSLALLLASPPIALTASAVVPPGLAADRVRPFRRLVVLIAAIQCLITIDEDSTYRFVEDGSWSEIGCPDALETTAI